MTVSMTEAHDTVTEQTDCKKIEKWCGNYVFCDEVIPRVVLECLALNTITLTSMSDEKISSDINNTSLINSMPLEIRKGLIIDDVNITCDTREKSNSMIDTSSDEIPNYKSVKERTDTLIKSVTCEAAEREILKLQKETLINAAIKESSQFRSVKERKKSLLTLFNNGENSNNVRNNIRNDNWMHHNYNDTETDRSIIEEDSLIDSITCDSIEFDELDNDQESLVDSMTEEEFYNNWATKKTNNREVVLSDSVESIQKLSKSCQSLKERKEYLLHMVSDLMDSNKVKDEDSKMNEYKQKYYDEKKDVDDTCRNELPEQLSVNQMMSLGTVISKKSTVIKLEKFFVKEMVWSSQQERVEFIIDKTPLGKGTYREASRATCLNEKHSQMKKHYVVKRLLKRDNQKNALTPEQEARQTVQMHMLAKHFTDLVRKYVTQEVRTHRFGSLFRYNDIYYGINESGEVVTVEEYVGGKFEKYINNNGEVIGAPDSEISLKAVAYMHFSFDKSNKQLLLTDLQGVQYDLVDPEISSLKLRDEKQYKLFAAGNLSVFALKKFVETHRCNRFCRMLDLKEISYDEKQDIFNHYLNHLNCLVKCRLNSKFGSYFAMHNER